MKRSERNSWMLLIGGLLLCLTGIVFGLWAGVWWAFIGGIADIINGIKAPGVDALKIAGGLAKFCFSALIGWGSALLLILPGAALVKSA